MRTVTYNLQQFLTEARRGAFVIPRFQRPFIWSNSQVKLLVDSIARNYPIGSLLLLQETIPADPFLASRPVDAVIKDAENGAGDDYDGAPETSAHSGIYYVLDGQQRLTSLVRVFLQSSTDSYFYFDLQKLLNFHSAERISPNWVIQREPNRKLSHRYLRSDYVADAERCQVFVEEYFESGEESLKGNRHEQRKASARVNRVFETIRNYQIPLVIIDRGDSTEAICRIFETINSTGTRLTTFDLAVARFFPDPDLHQLWQESIERHAILNQFNAEGERVLQVIALMVGFETKNYLEPTRGTLLSMSRQEIINRWDIAAKALARAYEWIEEHGGVPNMVANEALLVPLALFLFSINDAWKHQNPGYASVLERWYFSNALAQGARQASNYRIAQTTAALRLWITEGKVPEITQVVLTNDELLRLAKSDNRYRAIHSLLRWKGGRDLWTEERLRFDDVEDHHIFPAALAKREGLSKRQLDSVANKLLVSTLTNRQLGDRTPYDYVGKLLRDAQRTGTLEAKLEMFRAFCLPTHGNLDDILSMFDQGRVEEFLKLRSTLILEKLRSILGDALQSSRLDTDEDEEDIEE